MSESGRLSFLISSDVVIVSKQEFSGTLILKKIQTPVSRAVQICCSCTMRFIFNSRNHRLEASHIGIPRCFQFAKGNDQQPSCSGQRAGGKLEASSSFSSLDFKIGAPVGHFYHKQLFLQNLNVLEPFQ